MITKSLLPVTLLSLALAFTARGQAAGQPQATLPASDDIQKLVDAGQYQDALKAISQALPGLGLEPTPSAKRYALYMLRGESLLQLKLSAEAIAAYASAVRDAPKPADAALPAATEILIKRSTAFTYTPKATPDKVPPKPKTAPKTTATTHPTTKPAATQPSGPPPADTPLNILDHQQRTIALVGLFYDLLIPDTALLKDVKADTALQPTIDFAPTVHTLNQVEIAATTTDNYSAAMNDDLTTHAHDLMAKALTSIATNVDSITRSANQSVTINIPTVTGSGSSLRNTTKTEYRKHGLSGSDSTSLADSITTCNKIADAVKTLTTALNAPPKTFAPIVTEAESQSK